jgi:hypothetical protein
MNYVKYKNKIKASHKSMRKSTEHFSARRLSGVWSVKCILRVCYTVPRRPWYLRWSASSGARFHDRSYTPNCGGWNRSRQPYGAYLHGVPPFISMAVVQVPHFMWFQPYVQAGRGSMLENVFLSTARLRGRVSRSDSVVPRTQTPFVFAWVFLLLVVRS